MSAGKHVYRWFLRATLILYHGLILLVKILPKRKYNEKKGLRVLATGTFYSDHWLITHLRPMGNAENCIHLKMVASAAVPQMDKVFGAYAPKWLEKIIGTVGGGFSTENRIFSRIGLADYFIEALLLKVVNEMDLVISMGTSAIEFFKNKGVKTQFEIVPGGFDDNLFYPNTKQKKLYDLILIGRLSEIKRVDRFLGAIKLAKEKLPSLNAVIVGDGPDKKGLEDLALKLGIADDVDFVGWQNNVHIWLQKSKCFVLTSDSEGLSQALIQAMMTGLPSITSDVGDLENLLKNNENGYLVSPLSEINFATAYIQLFSSQNKKNEFSRKSYSDTRRFSLTQVELQWNEIFLSFR